MYPWWAALQLVLTSLLVLSHCDKSFALLPAQEARLFRRMFAVNGKPQLQEPGVQSFSAPLSGGRTSSAPGFKVKLHHLKQYPTGPPVQPLHASKQSASVPENVSKRPPVPMLQGAETCVSSLYGAPRDEESDPGTLEQMANRAQNGLGRCHHHTQGNSHSPVVCWVKQNWQKGQHWGKPCVCRSRWCSHKNLRPPLGSQCWCDLDDSSQYKEVGHEES